MLLEDKTMFLTGVVSGIGGECAIANSHKSGSVVIADIDAGYQR